MSNGGPPGRAEARDEPAGWRDERGSSPLEVLEAFRHARFELDKWYTVNHPDLDRTRLKMDTAEYEGARVSPPYTEEAWPDVVADRLSGLVDTFGMPSQHGRAATFSWPSRYAHTAWAVTGAERRSANRAHVFAESGALVGLRERFRFDLRKVDGQWRIERIVTYLGEGGPGTSESL